jgi:hypothetical protein
MLRGKTETTAPAAAAAAGIVTPPALLVTTGFPGRDQAYATDERPPGILFYQAEESFWLPYHLLQAMQCRPDRLALAFASDDVVLIGRGLHELYLQLARQAVWRIVEQGERYAGISNAPVFVARIERTAADRKG